MISSYICDTPADIESTDGDDRHMVYCPNRECGHYQISKVAIVQLENRPAHKSPLREFVNRHMKKDNLVEITYNIWIENFTVEVMK